MSFPSFRKARKYRGGFEKFVYDTLKELSGSSDESESTQTNNNTDNTDNNTPPKDDTQE